MKVSAFIPLILSSTALAASRRSHDVVTARQAQIKRGLVDVCVALDLDVTLLDILPGGKPLVAGHVELCLCVSVLPDFIRSNSVGQNVVRYLGEAPAQDFFTNLINSQPNKQQCHYPDHCEPICDWEKPCHFHCKDGFVPDDEEHPTKCICPPPNTVCNGQCGSFPNGCGSQTPKRKRAPSCSSGRTLCGVPGGSKGKGYDCVDTKSDLESCGGCVVKNSFGIETPAGKDCSAIAHVDRVKCKSSSCHVSSCKEGYTPSKTHDSCVVKHGKRDEWDDLLHLCVDQGLIAKVADLAHIKEVLLANLHVARGLHDSPELDRGITILLEKGFIIVVHTLVEVKARLGLVAHVARDLHDSPDLDRGILILLQQGALINVLHTVAEVREALGLLVHIGRRDQWDDLLHLAVAQGLIAKVADLVWIKELLLANLHVARGLEDTPELDRGILILLEKGIFIGVKTLLEVKARLGLLVHVARGNEWNQWDDLVDALAKLGLLANVADLVAVKAALLAALHVA